MEFSGSDIVTRRGGAEFSAVHFGDSATLSVVKIRLTDGRTWIVSPNKTRMTNDYVEQVATNLQERALYLAADAAIQRFLPEAVAYVRGLPMGRRSNFLNSTDRSLLGEAVSDVKDALLIAIQSDDPYRAAVEFEKRVPYLIADRGLVDVMDTIVGTFRNGYDETEWLALAADEIEDCLSKDSTFMSAQISAWKAASGNSGALSAH